MDLSDIHWQLEKDCNCPFWLCKHYLSPQMRSFGPCCHNCCQYLPPKFLQLGNIPVILLLSSIHHYQCSCSFSIGTIIIVMIIICSQCRCLFFDVAFFFMSFLASTCFAIFMAATLIVFLSWACSNIGETKQVMHSFLKKFFMKVAVCNVFKHKRPGQCLFWLWGDLSPCTCLNPLQFCFAHWDNIKVLLL